MSAAGHSREIRAKLDYPVIDCDGHMVEYMPPVEDYVKKIGGGSYDVRFFPALGRRPNAPHGLGSAPIWWAFPSTNTLDRATAALPRLLNERLGDFGIDYSILFCTPVGWKVSRKGPGENAAPVVDLELQQVTHRALNAYRMDICREFAQRMTPAAVIPMDTPELAIAELEASAKEGYKAVQIGPVRRPIPGLEHAFPKVWRLDNLSLDSDYDYDPFWARCLELKLAVMQHGPGHGFSHRASPTNYLYNAAGHFSDCGDAMCRGMLLGGVTRRFPKLKVAMLEGGVLGAIRSFTYLLGAWDKRGPVAIDDLDPRNLDRPLFERLHAQYAGEVMGSKLDRLLDVGAGVEIEEIADRSLVNDYALTGAKTREELAGLFLPHFYFGCEGEDPSVAAAFQEGWPLGAKFKTLYGSDIGHWDVKDMADALHEAYEQVEDGRLTEEQLRTFLCDNAVEFLTNADPDFFVGTAAQSHAASA